MPNFNRRAGVPIPLQISNSLEGWAARIQAGDRRAIARAITQVENGGAAAIPLIKLLFTRSRAAEVIGITGPPGAGKSTLVELLAALYRRRGMTVGVLAVDPTSPFTGGALLGDRIRMQRLSTDEGVFIRSLATRGQLGGIAAAAYDAVVVLEAAGFGVILVETVGVGQDEVEIASLANATLVVLAPGMGDDVQALKAGILEIGDVFVVNKADRPGADHLQRDLSLATSRIIDGWTPPVVQTIATAGEGLDRIEEALNRFRTHREAIPAGHQRLKEMWRRRLLQLARQHLLARWARSRPDHESLDVAIERLIRREQDPHSVVDELIRAAGSKL